VKCVLGVGVLAKAGTVSQLFLLALQGEEIVAKTKTETI
jgi:hypothetical protein